MVYVLECSEVFQFLDDRGEELDAFVRDFILVKSVQQYKESWNKGGHSIVNDCVQSCKLGTGVRAEVKGWEMVYGREYCERCQFLDDRSEVLDADVSNLIPVKASIKRVGTMRTALINDCVWLHKRGARAEGKG